MLGCRKIGQLMDFVKKARMEKGHEKQVDALRIINEELTKRGKSPMLRSSYRHLENEAKAFPAFLLDSFLAYSGWSDRRFMRELREEGATLDTRTKGKK